MTGPTNCHFTGAATTGGGGDERPPATEGVVVEIGDDRGVRIEPRRVEGDAAVLADGDSGETDQCLRDHALGGGTLRQGRDGGELERCQGEVGGGGRVAVRKAADPCGDTTW